MNRAIMPLALASALGVLPGQALAATYTLAPTKDSYIKQAAANENHGTDTELLVNEKTASSDNHRTLYAFSLASIPVGETITSATLRLYVRQPGSASVNVHRITDTWVESTVTWSNTSADFAASASAIFTPGTNETYVTADVTTLAQAWKAGTFANNGVMLISSVQLSESKYTSREWSTSSQRPQLVIVTAPAAPNLAAAKTSSVVSDPVNGSTSAKFIPGAVADYVLVVSNSAGGSPDANTVVAGDLVPSGLKLFVGNLGGAGSGPVAFTDGSPSSGLTYTYTSLVSTTDSLSFSNNGGASYAYAPSPDADGYDAAVTHFRVVPSGTMAGAGGSNTSFQLRFRMRLN